MDADNDLRYYFMMKAWKQNDNSSFNFYDSTLQLFYFKQQKNIQSTPFVV